MEKLKYIFIVFIFIGSMTGCSVSYEVQDKKNSSSAGQIVLKIDGNPTRVEVNEGSTIVLMISQSKKRSKLTAANMRITDSAGFVNQTFPTATSINSKESQVSFSIPINESITTVSLPSVHNLAYSGDRIFNLSFITADTDISSQLPSIEIKVKDLETPPELSFALPTANFTEGTGNQSISVQLNRASTAPISVPYTVSPGTATPGSDYISTNGTLTFSPGETSKSIIINILEDVVVESGLAENFQIQLGSINGTAIPGNFTFTGNIVDNDSETLSLSATSANEGSSLQFTVTLSNSSPNTITVHYSSLDGTASAGTNFTETSGILTFAPGQISKTISVPTTALTSSVCDTDKTMTMQLSDASGASIATLSAIGTIIDPDRPTISIADATAVEGNPLSFVVSLSQICPTHAVNFEYASSSGTATSSTDFVSVASSAVIATSQISTSISVSSVEDFIFEGDESFSVSIANPTGATIGDLQATGVITEDDVNLGTFNITGITSTNDSTLDSNLNHDLNPTVNWTASTSATSYDIIIYEADGTTVKCALENTTLNAFSFSSCSLTPGLNYKARVFARFNQQSFESVNSPYSFKVNQEPTLGSDGAGPWFVLAGSSINLQAQWASSPTVGVAVDADGDTLSYSAIGTSSKGALINNGAHLTFSPTTSSFGAETISVTISDGNGGTITQNITFHIMTAFTWTGAASSTWSTAGNWCGSIASDHRSCTGSSSAPGTSSTIVFDDTCASTFTCSPVTSANLEVFGVRISANGFSQGTGRTFKIGNSGYGSYNEWQQSGGTFTGSDSAITFYSPVSISGGTFNSTSGGLGIYRNFTLSGTGVFNHNNGTTNLFADLSPTFSASLINLNHLNFYNGSSWTVQNLAGTFNVLGNLDYHNSGYGTSVSGGTINVSGNVTHNGSTTVRGFNTSNTIRMVGGVGSTSTLTAAGEGFFGNIEIASLGSVTLANTGTIDIRGNFTYTSGTVTATGSTVRFLSSAAQTITANSLHLHHVTISKGGTAPDTLSGTLYIDGDLSIGGYQNWPSLNGGTFVVKGNLTITSGYYTVNNSNTIRMVGDSGSSVNITGGSGSCIGSLEIASSGTVNFASTGSIDISGSYTYTSGNLITTGSTLKFVKATADTFTPGNVSYNSVTFAKGSSAPNTLVGTFNIDGNLNFTLTGLWPTINGGIFKVKGDLSSNAGWRGGSSAIELIGTTLQKISMTGSSYMPGASVTINNPAGVELSSNVTLLQATAGVPAPQNINIVSGNLDMKGFNLTLSGAPTLNGNILTKSAGVLTVNGTVVGTGALYGGTINP